MTSLKNKKKSSEFTHTFNYHNITNNISISEQQNHVRTKGVFCVHACVCVYKLCIWTSGSHEDMMVQLLSRYRDQTLKKYFSPRPLFLSWFGLLAEGRTFLIVLCLEWKGIWCLSVPGLCVWQNFELFVSSWWLDFNVQTFISFSWVCFRRLWSSVLSFVLSLHVVFGIIRPLPDWLSKPVVLLVCFVLSFWFWCIFELWVPLHQFPPGLFCCFWLLVSSDVFVLSYSWYVIIMTDVWFKVNIKLKWTLFAFLRHVSGDLAHFSKVPP